uniref:Uncharacterized protein n=1 Tax=Poecilia mexicana TaxID=48701 RepID=A0A3B3WX40_9TELE
MNHVDKCTQNRVSFKEIYTKHWRRIRFPLDEKGPVVLMRLLDVRTGQAAGSPHHPGSEGANNRSSAPFSSLQTPQALIFCWCTPARSSGWRLFHSLDLSAYVGMRLCACSELRWPAIHSECLKTDTGSLFYFKGHTFTILICKHP